MTTNLKAIDTEYKGFRFRSRLEARWAVFMDAMGVQYEYEPEGYDLDGIRYLPDFWLPLLKAHLEIKPMAPTDEEQEKAWRLATHSKMPVYVMIGQPECPNDQHGYFDNCKAEAFFPREHAYEYRDGLGPWDAPFLWCHCPHCLRCELQFEGRADRISCGCPGSSHGDKGYSYETPRLKAAYARARGYRFEQMANNP